jgi:hypothetical protein
MSESEKTMLVLAGRVRRRRQAEFKRLAEHLLDRGYSVTSFCEPTLIVEHDRFVAEEFLLPVAFAGRIISSIADTLLAPIRILLRMIPLRASHIIVSEPRSVYLVLLAAVLSRTPIILLLDCVPWGTRQRKKGMYLLQLMYRFFEKLAMLFAGKIVVPTNWHADELKRGMPTLFFSKLIVMPYRNSLDDTKAGAEHQSAKDFRETLSIPPRNLLIASLDSFAGHIPMEYLIRAISAGEKEDVSLLACGEPFEQGDRASVVSITVSLGLIGQVIFISDDSDSELACACADLVVLPSDELAGTYKMSCLLQSGVPILAPKTPLMEHCLPYPELLFEPNDVQNLLELIQHVKAKNSHYLGIQKCVNEARERLVGDWSADFYEILLAS